MTFTELSVGKFSDWPPGTEGASAFVFDIFWASAMVSAPAARPGNCQELNEVVMSSTELRESYAGKTHQISVSCVGHTLSPVSGLGRNLQTGMMARARCRSSLKRSVAVGWKATVLELVKIDSETLSFSLCLSLSVSLSHGNPRPDSLSLSAFRDLDVPTLCFSLHHILVFYFSPFLPANNDFDVVL